MMTTPHILFVDDEPAILQLHSRMVESMNVHVHTTSSAAEALDILNAQDIHVLVSDECMPGVRGRELLAKIRVEHPHVVTILLTGYASVEAAMAAVNEGNVFRLLSKPCDSETLQRALRQALDYQLLLESASQYVEVERTRLKALQKLEVGNPGIGEVERDSEGFIELNAPNEAELKELEAVLVRASRRRN